MIRLPRSFLARPIAHRGLHDISQKRAENSLPAMRAAIEHGYGIEIDVQCSKDGQAMVFHDYSLQRLTGQLGAVQSTDAADLARMTLCGADDTIPTLKTVLETVAGKVPLLIEIKDQDGALGPNVGRLETAVAADLATYDGPAAVMSFNPHAIKAFRSRAAAIPYGLVTDPFDKADWPLVPQSRLDELTKLEDVIKMDCGFISHKTSDLASPIVADLKGKGLDILCWTVKSKTDGETALRIADNITFEGYLP
ncbi:MAG: glycerophosphodiester phosphodiesterase family protein [Planktomarina sp.]